jgi:hypothetical protein
MGSLQSDRVDIEKTEYKNPFIHYAPALGIALVIGGILLFIDQKIKTGWIPISLPVVVGMVIVAYGFYLKNSGWLIAGFVISGLSGALFLIFQPFVNLLENQLLALGLAFFALNWMALFLSIGIIQRKLHWWTIFIISVAAALAAVFLFGDTTLLVFMLAISIALGFSFILWGVAKKNIGLMIPGLLISSIGIGVFNGWRSGGDINGLRDTGIMLVWFSLGWILITVISRLLKKEFIWWPLIPGGILAMVGSGLFIGGNPENAAGFLQNTGSIALVLLGIYLILLKFGLKK